MKKHSENIQKFTASLEKSLMKSLKHCQPSGCKFQCTARLGKIAWYVEEELLCQQPLTLEKFTSFFFVQNEELKIKEDMYAR